MKKLAAITLTSMMLLLATAMVVGAVPSVEIRGAVAGTVNGQSNLAGDSFSWDPQTFAGFYYDIKKDLGNEKLTFTLTGEGDVKNKLSGDDPRGINYVTSTQNKAFERDLWGSYKVIGFQAERYFAGYNQGNTEEDGSNIFYKETTDKNSLTSEQLEKILMDKKDEMTVTSGTPLKLEEGYELAIKAIDIDGNKVYLELSKDGQVVDSKVVSPSKDNANQLDKTYYYKNPKVGEQTKLVTIGVHFKNAFRGADTNLASIDGIWQISATPTEVKADTQYGKMTIKTVTADSITMNNKDNAITLSKNKDTELMPGVNIKTADNDTLRFYIYKPVTIEGTAAPAAETVAANVTAEAAPATAEAAPAAAEAAKTVEAVKENVTGAAKTVEAVKENVTGAAKAAEKATPGFESLFAITGLLAVAYLVLGRRD
jgi:S-layer protein (TIGR01567 family)